MSRSLAVAAILALAMTAPLAQAQAPGTDDPYQWLEDVEGARAMAWVKEQNAVSQPQLEATPGFQESLATFVRSQEGNFQWTWPQRDAPAQNGDAGE